MTVRRLLCKLGVHSHGHSWSTAGWYYKTCQHCGDQQQHFGRDAHELIRKREATYRAIARQRDLKETRLFAAWYVATHGEPTQGGGGAANTPGNAR